MRINPAIICGLYAAFACTEAFSVYVNPTTSPVPINRPIVGGSTSPGFYDYPGTINLNDYFKEFTSPGPVLTFHLNTPATAGTMPDSFKVQIFWLDPEPEAPVENDSNYVVDEDDERNVFENLDLTDQSAIPMFLNNAITYDPDSEPALNGSLFWRVGMPTLPSGLPDIEHPTTIEAGVYHLDADTSSSHLVQGNENWGTASPAYNYMDYSEGTLCLFNTQVTYSLVFNLADNNEEISAALATIGQVFSEDLPTVKALAGYSTYDACDVWNTGSSLSSIPLWKSYTQEDFDMAKQPEREDFVSISSITFADLADPAPTHGLKYIEDLPYSYETTDEEGVTSTTTVDSNSAIRTVFDVSITEDGVVSLTLKADRTLNENYAGDYYFYFRTYVNDGVNDGLTGDYYRTNCLLRLYKPLVLYLYDAVAEMTLNYVPADVDTTAEDYNSYDYAWTWYKSTTFGWVLGRDFPNNRWVFSYEHGWINMEGESTVNEEGVYWYVSPSSYAGGESATEDDELGWIWTSYSYYPFMYSYKDDGWVRYMKNYNLNKYDLDKDGQNILSERVFWSYRQNKYITADMIGAGLATE
ncbi:MAG: hypothetical protein WC360_05820 [Opitutales bacterium]|jgi:hypothetical protein